MPRAAPEKNVIPLQREVGNDQDAPMARRMAETDRLTLLLINDEPVEVNGSTYAMKDVLRDLLESSEHRPSLRENLCGLLHADRDQEALYVSRINRLLIAGARTLAFRLSDEACCGQVVKL
ncbi:hypothetical protein [Candidatus Sororendozoicomonas aggregata]|uniref:hypothetical protein n=1 Tax=Candidatus Sororendozoicomonas aggregata TaxID=3073239 RepID=UPI002ED2D15D